MSSRCFSASLYPVVEFSVLNAYVTNEIGGKEEFGGGSVRRFDEYFWRIRMWVVPIEWIFEMSFSTSFMCFSWTWGVGFRVVLQVSAINAASYADSGWGRCSTSYSTWAFSIRRRGWWVDFREVRIFNAKGVSSVPWHTSEWRDEQS